MPFDIRDMNTDRLWCPRGVLESFPHIHQEITEFKLVYL